MNDTPARIEEYRALEGRTVVYCHHGVRSRTAAEQLLQRGFTQVFNLVGGIDAWSATVDGDVPRY
ncbi:MAG: hypothetical protein KC731_09900, partial [Myxococcales bacterium]|nr:hypothetical protein [Myxococcales bacterium]